MKHRGTDFALHIGRAHWALARARRACAAQLYVDLVSAFASAARELIHTPGRSPGHIADIMAKFDMPPDSLELFVHVVS